MATKETKDGLGYIIQAISNIVEPKVADLRYDKTYRAKVTEKVEAGIYKVKINGREYQLEYKGDLNVEDIVRVKAPLNNFSDIYIEALPSSGGGGEGGTTNYNDLLNKPILNTNNSLSLEVNNNETLKGNISLHKISKTGSYNDLNNLPDLNFIPTKEKGANNGVASLGADSRVPKAQLPTDVVYDNDYVHTNNNFTNDLKTKLDGIEAGAQQNTIDGIQRNGTPIQIKNKVVNILVPTKTSDLENDNNFISDSNYVHTDNNFTNTLKNKLDGIEAGAEVNIINTIQKNGVPLSVNNKTVNVIVPTKTSDLTNDSGFIKKIPIASTSVLGGIKVGANLNIAADGTLSAITGGGTNITKTSELTNDGEDGSSPYATQQYVGTQVATKQNTIKGAATTITDSNLTANRTLISDNNGKVTVSSITNTELGYLDGVTSNLQTQIDSKQSKISENSAFNKNFETTVSNIKMDGVASLGTSSNIPRSDHVHPTDTTRTQAHGNTTNYLYSCISNSIGAETVDQPPDAYYYEGAGRYRELKSSSAIGLQNEQEYVQLETIIWSDQQGMFFGGMQIAYGNNIWFRAPGIANWGSWKAITS
jgi:hypothetical protein